MLLITNQFIEKLKNRDEDAFSLLYNEYVRLIYHIAYSYTHNREDSEDIVNEVFMKIMSSLDNYHHQNKFKEWICSITRNHCLNYVSRNKERDNILDEELIQQEKDHSSNSLHLIMIFDDYLDQETRQIMILRFIYHYKFKDIATILGITIGKTQSLYYNGLDILRKVYDNNEN